MEKLVLTISETAAVLGIGRSKMFELLASGRLPVLRMGKVVRIPRPELEDWIREQTAASLTPGVDSDGAERSLWKLE